MYLFMVSHPTSGATSFAEDLIDNSLAACVHALPAGTSIYCWDGEKKRESETLLLVKTAVDIDVFSQRALEMHPYDCPEIIALEVTGGLSGYLEWVQNMTRGTS